MDKAFDLLPSLTPREAAKLLNLPTQTILDMIKRKELPAVKVNENRWRISKSEVVKLISHSF
jgi:excisionase family DNA binding protein